MRWSLRTLARPLAAGCAARSTGLLAQPRAASPSVRPVLWPESGMDATRKVVRVGEAL